MHRKIRVHRTELKRWSSRKHTVTMASAMIAHACDDSYAFSVVRHSFGGVTCGAEHQNLHALDSDGPLAVELHGIPFVTLLLTVLQALALVVLEHAMLTAVVTAAEAAVAYDALGSVLAGLEGAADLLWGHSSAQWEGHVDGGVWGDGVGF